MTSILPLKPRELQSVSRLTARADLLSVISSRFKVTSLISAALKYFNFHQFFITMYRNHSLNSSTDSDVFYVEHSSPERSPIRNNTPAILNSTQLSGAMDPETTTISSFASPEPHIVTIESDSNEPTFPYAFGTQHPKVPPSLNDLNLPANPFIVLATMAVIQQDQEDSPQSPEPSDPSPNSTPPMNLSTIEGWETPHTTTEDNTFYSSENEPRRIERTQTSLSRWKPILYTATKEKIEHRDVFSSKGGSVAAHLRGMRPTPSRKKDILMLRGNLNSKTNQTLS